MTCQTTISRSLRVDVHIDMMPEEMVKQIFDDHNNEQQNSIEKTAE